MMSPESPEEKLHDIVLNLKLHHDLLRAMGRSGVDLDEKSTDGETGLHVLARGNLSDEEGGAAAKELIAHGATVDSLDAQGATPLHIAVKNAKKSIVTVFLTEHATVDSMDKDGTTPLHIAVETENNSLISLLLEHGAKNLPDKNGQTPLHLVCHKYNRPILKLFLKTEGVKNFNSQNNEGKTPLILLIERTKHGLRVRRSSEGYWKAVLEDIITAKDFEMLEIICDFNSKFEEGSKILSWDDSIKFACEAGYLEVLEFFKTKLGDIEFIEKVNNANALCAATSSLNILNYLIKLRANVNQIGTASECPLHHVVRGGKLKFVVALLKSGANPNIPNIHGKIPIFYANSVEIVEILLIYGSNLSSEILRHFKCMKHPAANQKTKIIELLRKTIIATNVANAFMNEKELKIQIDSEDLIKSLENDYKDKFLRLQAEEFEGLKIVSAFYEDLNLFKNFKNKNGLYTHIEKNLSIYEVYPKILLSKFWRITRQY